MPTAIFSALPWTGGLNTSEDEAMIGPDELTVADNIVIGSRMARKKREGINYDWDDGANAAKTIIKGHDFWFGATTRSQRQVAVASTREVYSYNSGTRTTLTDTGTAWAGTLTTASMCTYNNLCIIAVDGANNVVKKWDGTTLADLDGTPPEASFVFEHLGRLWMNDKDNPDRLHYSPTHDHTRWNGADDSGAIDIGIGDGDPEGIVAAVPFKGDLFVFKKTKVYRVTGYYPETFQPVLFSNGIGCVGPNAIATIDTDDVLWVSDKGIHSLAATDSYGDFKGAYVSQKIQRTFSEDLQRSRLKYVHAAYLSDINSVAFSVTEESGLNRSLTTSTVNNAIYLLNVEKKAWYRWPDCPASALWVANDSARKRFYLGTHTARVAQTFTGERYDKSYTGANTAIRYKLQTGIIYPQQSPWANSAFKNLTLYFKPTTTSTISVKFKVDNQRLSTENNIDFTEDSGGTPLGTGFTLGSTPLGGSSRFSGYTRMIDGHGRGFYLTIESSGLDQDLEIQGFAVEYEPAGKVNDTFTSRSA